MLRRRLALFVVALVLAPVVSMIATEAADAAIPVQVTFVNAIDGPARIDVYVDGGLVAPGVKYLKASAPVTLPVAVDHIVVVFVAIDSPSATVGGRADQPLETAQLSSQTKDGQIQHTNGPAVIRLFNLDHNDRWFPIEHTVYFDDFPCEQDRPQFGFEGSADVGAGNGYAAGSGELGSGGTRSQQRPGTEVPLVIRGDRRFELRDGAQYTFGSFDFGTVVMNAGFDRMYVTYGNADEYGVIELVVDCATKQIVSIRTPAPNPTFPSSRFIPVDPVRLFDTREPAPPSGSLPPNSSLDVQVTGEVGIPAKDVTAVVLNVTATNSTGPGFVTVSPTGAPRPTTSNINVTGANQAVPNLVTVPVGAGGKVSFYSLGGVDLLADVAGYYVEANSAKAGRFVPLDPARVFDTRQAPAPQGVVGPGSSVRVPIAGEQGVPETGASAVVLNLTGVNVGGPGFVTTYPGGTKRPEASNLNLLFPGDVSPNLVIVPLGDDGSVEFYSSSGAHVFADVFGYFTDESVGSSASGLFVPTTPTRVIDTRPTTYNRQWDRFIGAGTDLEVPINHNGDVPAVGIGAVLANITATESAAPGFVTAWPTDSIRPEVSNLNQPSAGYTRPNAALVPIGADGRISLYSLSGVHAIVDVFGYFTE